MALVRHRVSELRDLIRGRELRPWTPSATRNDHNRQSAYDDRVVGGKADQSLHVGFSGTLVGRDGSGASAVC